MSRTRQNAGKSASRPDQAISTGSGGLGLFSGASLSGRFQGTDQCQRFDGVLPWPDNVPIAFSAHKPVRKMTSGTTYLILRFFHLSAFLSSSDPSIRPSLHPTSQLAGALDESVHTSMYAFTVVGRALPRRPDFPTQAI